MEEIKSITIPEDIIIVENYEHQGYVVLPDKPSMLESAMNWAHRWVYDYSIKGWEEREKSAVEFFGIQNRYKNGQFRLKLCESANNSWNGGKLSFWNCTITAPDGKDFLIGINQELLCNLLQSCTVVKGVVQEDVWLGRQKNNTGVYTVNMEDFIQAKEEIKLKTVFSDKTSSYVVGDIVGTLTKQYVYAGVIYEHYTTYTSYDYNIHSYLTELSKCKDITAKHLYIPYNSSDETIEYESTWDTDATSKKRRYTGVGHVNKTTQQLFNELMKTRRGVIFASFSTSKEQCLSPSEVQDTMTDKHISTSSSPLVIKFIG